MTTLHRQLALSKRFGPDTSTTKVEGNLHLLKLEKPGDTGSWDIGYRARSYTSFALTVQ